MNIVKEELLQLLLTITRIVNLSLTEGIFSDNWKTAIVRPLLKQLGVELKHNKYRPISNLSFISKVVEKCALDQPNAHGDSNNLMPSYQSAYRKHFSTETALLKICNDILWSMGEQQTSAFIAIGLSAAWTPWTAQPSLMSLRPRYCKINVGHAYSDPRKLAYSVPQGSCAGPVL